MDEKNKKKGKRDGIYIWNEKGQRENRHYGGVPDDDNSASLIMQCMDGYLPLNLML